MIKELSWGLNPSLGAFVFLFWEGVFKIGGKRMLYTHLVRLGGVKCG